MDQRNRDERKDQEISKPSLAATSRRAISAVRKIGFSLLCFASAETGGIGNSRLLRLALKTWLPGFAFRCFEVPPRGLGSHPHSKWALIRPGAYLDYVPQAGEEVLLSDVRLCDCSRQAKADAAVTNSSVFNVA